MFTNTTASLSGELADLLTHLESAYRAKLDVKPGVVCDSDAFCRWAQGYLTDNRPSEVFPVANNYGVLLTNGQRVKLCPDVPGISYTTGDMANPDTSISISRKI